jgi:hypothetical protein
MARKRPSPLGVTPLIETTPRNNKQLRSLIYRMGGPYAETYFRHLHALAVGRRKSPPSVQLQALLWILERIYGRQPQPNINVDLEPSAELRGLADEEIIARIGQLAASNPRLAAALQRGTGAPARRIIEAPGT